MNHPVTPEELGTAKKAHHAQGLHVPEDLIVNVSSVRPTRN